MLLSNKNELQSVSRQRLRVALNSGVVEGGNLIPIMRSLGFTVEFPRGCTLQVDALSHMET